MHDIKKLYRKQGNGLIAEDSEMMPQPYNPSSHPHQPQEIPPRLIKSSEQIAIASIVMCCLIFVGIFVRFTPFFIPYSYGGDVISAIFVALIFIGAVGSFVCTVLIIVRANELKRYDMEFVIILILAIVGTFIVIYSLVAAILLLTRIRKYAHNK